ncbi:MAG: M28 family peptidase, partial [Thermoanaerobaculia bacterium]|nr:M28 family peptidase [Thermoanaerobaculia bacterium]
MEIDEKEQGRCDTLAVLVWIVLATLAMTGSSVAEESHLRDLRQLTREGENAEAYWSPEGDRLVFQRTGPEGGCDQIYVLDLGEDADRTRVSSGQGRTTCAYFMPDGERILYSSTAPYSRECPPPPDRSRGYVWPVYDTFEILMQGASGEEPVRLTENRAYDAEATVCPVDGSIVFTSDRDGDLELYRMNPDGTDVQRLTEAPGYDGGAFFSPDCSRIVWRASRPRGEELEEYRGLLADGLVKPGHLEIWVANADGTDARQITYLGEASFAPSFFPSGDRIVFSSNWHGTGREFDLWAVDVQGTRLERITETEGFDGFPMFSPDGTRLAFGTNRFPGGPYETNVAVARWVEHPPRFTERGPDRFLADVRWLADDARQGRGAGTEGLERAADWLEARFRDLGLEPGYGGEYRQALEIPTAVQVEDGTRLVLDGEELDPEEEYGLTGFSASGQAAGEVVPVGYGIVAPELDRDDYGGIDLEGKIALVRRFVPPQESFEDPEKARRYGDLRAKAFSAREHGAEALLVVDLPVGEEVEEAPFPDLRVEQRGDAGIPVLVLKREVGRKLFEGGHEAEVAVELSYEKAPSANILGRLPATVEEAPPEPAIVVGAHYDHLGFGGSGSLAPDSEEPHSGADDNASGVAAMLETARILRDRELGREIWFV